MSINSYLVCFTEAKQYLFISTQLLNNKVPVTHHFIWLIRVTSFLYKFDSLILLEALNNQLLYFLVYFSVVILKKINIKNMVIATQLQLREIFTFLLFAWIFQLWH